MAFTIVAVIALLLGNLHLGYGTDIENEEGAGEESIAKQLVISAPFGDQRQTLNVPSIYQPRPQINPFNYQPQPQIFPPQPPIIQFISQPEPEITYEFADPGYAYPPEPQPYRSSGSGTNLATFLAILLLMDQIEARAAATTTPSTDDGCTYGEWGACSSNCKGTQVRSKTCSGVTQSESRSCNTQVGFQSSGWYRASNCYDYYVTQTPATYANVQTNCQDLGAELATVGMRDTAVRREVVAALFDTSEEQNYAYIGVDKIADSTTWVWLDGDTTEPNFWFLSEPNDASNECVVLVTGNANSLIDAPCTGSYRSYCERAPQ